MTTFRWYLLGLAILFSAYVAVEYYRPKPLNWQPTFQNKDKIPYGTYVLYHVLPEVLHVAPRDVRPIRLPIYNQLEGEDENAPVAEKQVYLEQEESVVDADTVTQAADDPAGADETFAETSGKPDSAQVATTDSDYEAGLAESDYPKATYLFVNDGFVVSREDTRALLRHAARGNSIFVAAEQFDAALADTLGFSTAPFVGTPRLTTPTSELLRTDSVQIFLSNANLMRAAGRSFRLPTLGAAYRILPDSGMQATQLAADAQGRAVLVRVPYGRGFVYLCSVPLAFTNYFVLRPATSNFAFAALSYLPVGQPVWWDEYQKQGRQGEQSLLRVLLAHDALRWALCLSLLGTVLFVLFEAKRRQRIIPVLRPLPNTTLLFTRTVAGLYRQSSNHALIAEKKISLFLEFLRTRFYEPSLDLNEAEDRARLAQKIGLPLPQVDLLVRRINLIRTAPQVSDTDLLLLSTLLNDFRKAAS
ncbi:DUF4350 domain-containing protein [Hymenobacter elongatus]|uniref:DUF4350 domain-containing protein n=1 Tax=Hymenobacter elongatus TaxID=877208 RepID=A0A4Z0PL41_9BACT|nr:DUF4350 domain-containing protein [Hymenobacter elongatus]TGE16266.1 DUF4350 domain-containing protein [Hymenobacter elongatus]